MTPHEQLQKLADDPELHQQCWDGYRAHPLTDESVEAVRRFLRYSVAIVPTVNGGIQLEWHAGDVNMELEYDSDGRPVGGLMLRASDSYDLASDEAK